ncbi:MAG: VOC family protein [Spirochaetes bacterium]|nr:VOC family protein [Spirochaetota bacterium]
MILRIDHIALAVRDYEKAFRFFSDLLGAVPGSYSKDDTMKYLWQNLYLGDLSRLELLTPTAGGSFLDGFLAKKEGGIHHMTLQTSSLKRAAALLDKKGIPYFGYREYGDVWKELFIHPKNAFGVLIQIGEFNADDWIASSVKMPEGKKFWVERSGDGCTITFAHPGGGKVSVNLDGNEMLQLRDELHP